MAAIFVLNYFLKLIDRPAYQPIVEQAPQILSKLFPQTADIQKSAEEIQREQQKKDEEEKKEQESSWKRMKLGYSFELTPVCWCCFYYPLPLQIRSFWCLGVDVMRLDYL